MSGFLTDQTKTESTFLLTSALLVAVGSEQGCRFAHIVTTLLSIPSTRVIPTVYGKLSDERALGGHTSI